MFDRRRMPRFRSLKSAQIDFHPNWPAIDCVIRNITSAGACLEMSGAFNTPLAYDLVCTADRTRRRCRQLWRLDNRIGIAFS